MRNLIYCFISDSESSTKDWDIESENDDYNSESSDLNEDSSSQLDSESDTSVTSEGGSFSDEELGEGDQPVCEGTSIKRRTFEATFLALANKHKCSKSARNNILKFLDLFVPKANLPTSNYTLEKTLMEGMDIQFSKLTLCILCNTKMSEGKCSNESCVQFNKKLNDYEMEICYFIPIKDQIQQISTGV